MSEVFEYNDEVKEFLKSLDELKQAISKLNNTLDEMGGTNE